jgi:hypothetical protein
MAPFDIPPVAEGVSTYKGQFTGYAGTEQLQVGLVLDGQIVLSVVYIDTVPASAAIMGDFAADISAAIGKLA